MQKSSMAFNSTEPSKTNMKVKINDHSGCSFKIYKGVDVLTYSYVMIYVRRYLPQNNNISKIIKDQLKQKLCPQVKWKGVQKINKYPYQIQVHQKYGPSIQQILDVYKRKLSEQTLYLLAYQIIKLLQKLSNLSYVYHQLKPQNIVLSSQPQKTQLYFLNVLEVKKKNEECQKLNSKYSSIGAHLGLNACFKDDLQSLSYILMDISTSGKLMSQEKINDYLQFKNNLSIAQLSKIPSTFVDFYIYCRNLCHNDQINYSSWKSIFKSKLPKKIMLKPYEWIANTSKLTYLNMGDSKQNKQNQNSLQQYHIDLIGSQVDDDKDQCLYQDQPIQSKLQKTIASNWNNKGKFKY